MPKFLDYYAIVLLAKKGYFALKFDLSKKVIINSKLFFLMFKFKEDK